MTSRLKYVLYAAITATMAYLFAETPALAQTEGLDSHINNAVAVIADPIVNVIFYSITINGAAVPLIVLWLIAAAAFFSVYFSFVNIRQFKLSLAIVRGHYTKPEDRGEVSHFQALSAALSGTVGLGNIAGVAVAISVGGPGATFWMILAGLLGMSSKFVECTLGVKYRQTNPDGSISGGPMYYLRDGLKDKGMAKTGRFLAVFFAFMCLGGALGAGNLFQVNQAFQQVESVTGGIDSFFYQRGWLFGALMAVVIALVIISAAFVP